MSVIREQSALWGAPRPALLETLAAFRGERFQPAASDDALRVQCSMAILSAQNATGVLGVHKESGRIVPLTITERQAIMKKDINVNRNYPEGTLAAELKSKRRKAPKDDAPVVTRLRIQKVRIAETPGESKVRASSVRGQVLAAVKAAGRRHGITVEALDEQLSISTRPHLQKLLEKAHIEQVV